MKTCEWPDCKAKVKPAYAYCAKHLEEGRKRDSAGEEKWPLASQIG